MPILMDTLIKNEKLNSMKNGIAIKRDIKNRHANKNL